MADWPQVRLDHDLLVADRHELLRLTGLAGDEAGELDDDEDAGEAGDGGAGSAEVDEALERLLGNGTEYVLLTGGGDHGPQLVDTLFGSEGIVRTDAGPRPAAPCLGAGTTLAATTEEKAMTKEAPTPAISRLSTSRPNRSVPIG